MEMTIKTNTEGIKKFFADSLANLYSLTKRYDIDLNDSEDTDNDILIKLINSFNLALKFLNRDFRCDEDEFSFFISKETITKGDPLGICDYEYDTDIYNFTFKMDDDYYKFFLSQYSDGTDGILYGMFTFTHPILNRDVYVVVKSRNYGPIEIDSTYINGDNASGMIKLFDATLHNDTNTKFIEYEWEDNTNSMINSIAESIINSSYSTSIRPYAVCKYDRSTIFAWMNKLMDEENKKMD